MRNKVSLLVLLFLANACLAGSISLQTTVGSVVKDNTLNVSLSIINKGNESAFNVQAVVRAGDNVLESPYRAELGAEGVYQAQLKYKLAGTKPGIYPLLVTINYTDANQYPFSALAAHAFALKQAAQPVISGQLQPAKLSRKGEMGLILKNLSGEKLQVQSYLFTPTELSEKAQKIMSRLDPDAEISAKLPLTNRSALKGSTYQVYAVTEYEKDGRHQTLVTPGTVEIVEGGAFLPFEPMYLVLALILFIALFILAQFIKKNK